MSPIPIFVGGCPRSGTTYVRNVIASHPDVTGLTAHNFGLAHEKTQTLEGWVFHRRLSPAALLQRWQAATLGCPTRYVVEKTPPNALIFDTIRQWFPDAQLVRVTRDKATTVMSIRKASKWAPLPKTKERAEALYERYARVTCGIPVDYDRLRESAQARAVLYKALGLSPYDGPVHNPEGIAGSKRARLAQCPDAPPALAADRVTVNERFAFDAKRRGDASISR